MRTLRFVSQLAVALCLGTGPAAAQHGELQLGPLLGHGSAPSFGTGAGAAVGISLGRLVYLGTRWLYYSGEREPVSEAEPASRIARRAHLYAADVALLLPVAGRFEIAPGVALGAARFRQRAAGSQPRHAWEFVGAPTLAVHTYVAGIVLIPELQYFWAGDPDPPLESSTTHQGWMASVRLVIPVEIGRIRY